MTALEQKLLDELELLEQERQNEQERMQRLSMNYEKSIEDLSKNLTAKYQSSLTELMQSEDKEQSSLIAYLLMITNQQKEIIEILKKPPKRKDVAEQLETILMPLFIELEQALVSSLEASNTSLIEELKILL